MREKSSREMPSGFFAAGWARRGCDGSDRALRMSDAERAMRETACLPQHISRLTA